MEKNLFLKETLMGAGANGAQTENGAISYASTGSELIDQFSKAGTARGRDINDVWLEQAKIWGENPLDALRFPFYLRMITRQSNLLEDGAKTEKVQKGQGARDEAFKRFLWIARNHPDEFYRNLWLIPVVGSWKDLWVLLSMDDTLDKEKFFSVFAAGINSASHKDLVKKYMPRIRSNKLCTTDWAKKTNALAKEFAKFAGWSMKEYREFKSTGKAHIFQRLICSRMYDSINWNTIPGKALLNLVSGDFLKRHNLTDTYVKWLKEQPTAKFNGYVYELAQKLPKSNGWSNSIDLSRIPVAQKITIDKQFDGLIATAEKDGPAITGNVLVALDTSGSMQAQISGASGGLTSFDVCMSLGIYFSALNKGEFHNTVAMFDNVSRLKKIKSETFTEKWAELCNEETAWGGTNFQSLIDLIVRTRNQNPNIPLEDFPQTLLVVSDMQFNPTNSYSYRGSVERERTNYEEMKRKLATAFPAEWVENFKCIWWYCASRDGASHDVPATMDMGGQYLFSGFDGAVISLLLGGEQVNPETGEKVQLTMEEAVQKALTQEVLMLVQ